jgi:hypothetical protein
MAYLFFYYQRTPRSSPGEIYIYRKTQEKQIYLSAFRFFILAFAAAGNPRPLLLIYVYSHARLRSLSLSNQCLSPGLCVCSRLFSDSPPPPLHPFLPFSHLLSFHSPFLYIYVCVTSVLLRMTWAGWDINLHTHPTRPINCFLDILPSCYRRNSDESGPFCYFIICFSFLFFYYSFDY